MENTFSGNVQDTYTTNNYGKQLTQKYENNITNDNFNQSNIHLTLKMNRKLLMNVLLGQALYFAISCFRVFDSFD